MNRWYGKVGYSETVETVPGVWTSQDTVREYYGDVKRISTRRTGKSDSTNDDVVVSTQISIVADPFAIEKFYSIKWIEFMGVKWEVDNVVPELPRLILTLGGVYNGQ
jgi:hypothetical protein